MDHFSFTYKDTAGVDQSCLAPFEQQLLPEVSRIKESLNKGYDSDYASIHLAFDEKLRHAATAMAADKKKCAPTMLIVNGIGGSNVCTRAIFQAVCGKLYNDMNPAIKIYFTDSVDPDYLQRVLYLAEQELKNGNNIIVNPVSKGGRTTETIANFELFVQLLQKYKKDTYHEYVVVTTDKDSPLWIFAGEQKYERLAIDKKVGGRYSGLSAVGLFPLAMLNVDIEAVHAGARSAIPACTNTVFSANYAALSASILYYHYKNGINIHNMFFFSMDLEGLGRWCRMLMGESLGKKHNRAGKQVHVGMTPVVSIGTIDLHTVTQLYLGGPYDKFTSFVSVARDNEPVTLPDMPIFEPLVPSIQGRPLSSLLDAILQGTKTAFFKDDRPYLSIEIPEKSAYAIGYYMQYKMIETMYLGYLLDINPFDQPNVEMYKKVTREILASE